MVTIVDVDTYWYKTRLPVGGNCCFGAIHITQLMMKGSISNATCDGKERIHDKAPRESSSAEVFWTHLLGSTWNMWGRACSLNEQSMWAVSHFLVQNILL